MIRAARALVLLAFAALAVLAPQARTGGRAVAGDSDRLLRAERASPRGDRAGAAAAREARAEANRASTGAAVVGDRRLWPALDAVQETKEYLKYFTLRALGTHIEVWVASDQDAVSKGLEFPAG